MVRKNKNEKKFGIILLGGLFAYAFLLIFLFNMGNVSVEHSETKAQTDLVGMVNTFEYREIEKLEVEEEAEKIKAMPVLQENREGEVKGIFSSPQEFVDYLRDFFVGSCDAFHKIDEAQLFCGGSGLNKTADIRIAQIWAPDIMFVGAAAPFDNLILTHNPRGDTAFRNSSEIINLDFEYYINMPPNHPSAPILDSVPLPDEEKFEPYDMHYEAAGNLNTIPNDVHPDAKGKCSGINDGKFNVKGSNNLQKELTDSITPPGIMKLGDRDVSSRVCDEYREIELWEDDSFLLCEEGVLQVLDCGTKFTFFDQCEGLGDIYIDGVLGSGEKCNENDCSVRYSEAANILSSPPSWTRNMYPKALTAEEKEDDYIIDDTVVITTPCYVRVNCQMCATRCIWDISMWQHVFQLEKMFTYPGYKNAMDDDLYWKKVEDEIKWRSRIGTRKY